MVKQDTFGASAEGQRSNILANEWHKCRRFWSKNLECPFHPLREKGRDEDPDENDPVNTPVREPLKRPRLPKPEFRRIPVPDAVPVGDKQPRTEPEPPPGGGGAPVPPPGVPLPIPVPIIPPLPLPRDPPPPPVERPPAVPVGGFEFTDGGPTVFPDGRPVLLRNGTFLGDETGNFELDDPEERDRLTPNLGEQYVNSIIRRFNKAFQNTGGLFLPHLPLGGSSRILAGEESLALGTNSIYQDVLSISESAYLNSLIRSQERRETRENVTRTRSESGIDYRRSAMVAVGAASAIGLFAFATGGGRGGGGGGDARSAVFDLLNPAFAR